MTFEPAEVKLFPKRSAKLIDGSKKIYAYVNWLLNFRVSVFLKSAGKQNNLMPLEIKGSALFMIHFTLMKIDSLYLV